MSIASVFSEKEVIITEKLLLVEAALVFVTVVVFARVLSGLVSSVVIWEGGDTKELLVLLLVLVVFVLEGIVTLGKAVLHQHY